MPDDEFVFARVELKSISIDGDTLHFDISGEAYVLQCEDVDAMCDVLNHFADQFVPISDDHGRQINPYYGIEALGLDRPGRAFYVDDRPHPDRPGGRRFEDLRVRHEAVLEVLWSR